MIHVSAPCFATQERELVAEVMRSEWLTHGRMVTTFEGALATRLGSPHAVATNSGTSALHLALVALGIGPGDEVLVPDLTYVATANAVAYTGATPVLVDIDPETWNIDLAEARLHLGPKTKAIIPVHLYGVPCDMVAVMAFAVKAGLYVIEDAAEGFGGHWEGRACGTWGHAAAFSFYGNKIITTGEGGAVTTSDPELATRLRHLRGQGQSPSQRFMHTALGFNYRMTDLHAAVGLGQLEHVDEMIERRQQVCNVYQSRLSSYGYTSRESCSEGYAPWLFTQQVMVGTRQGLLEWLAQVGVETRPAFVPLHRMPMYQREDREFPIANLIGDMGISLPTHAGMTLEHANYVCDQVVEYVEAVCRT